jgi:hypothetical protein
MEYSFYMPPSGRKFDNDEYRGNLANALLAIGNSDRSVIVMANDLESALAAENQPNTDILKLFNSNVPLNFLVNIASEESFVILSEVGANRLNWKRTRSAFTRSSDSLFAEYEVAKKFFDAWQALAHKDWKSPEQQELSKLILSLDPPRKLELPKSPSIK